MIPSGWSGGELQKLFPSGLTMANTKAGYPSKRLPLCLQGLQFSFLQERAAALLGIAVCVSRLPLFLTILFEDGSELQQTPWTLFPGEDKASFARIQPSCSGGDPARCLILMQSAQLHWLGASSPKTAHPGKPVRLRALQSHCEFGNRFRQQLRAKLSACDMCTTTGAAFQLIQTCTPKPACTGTPWAPEIANLQGDWVMRCPFICMAQSTASTSPSWLYLSLCRPALTTVKPKLLTKSNKNLQCDSSLW